MKYVAKQVPPQEQESPFSFGFDPSYIDGLAILGNRRLAEMSGTNTEPFFFARRELEDGYLYDDLKCIDARRFGGTVFKTATDAIRERFPREKPYTTREIGAIKRIVYEYGNAGRIDDERVCELLSITDGVEWKCGTINGICQGDWSRIVYRADLWDEDAIDRLEAEYFNTGSEWSIFEAEDAPVSDPNECCGLYTTVYAIEHETEALREELARDLGVDPSDVALFVFDGYSMIPRYTRA